MTHTETSRRAFLGGVAGAAVGGSALAARGRAASGVDLSGWFENTSNATRVVDKTGASEVTVEVGAEGNGGPFAYGPAVVRVDPGTTVTWSWVKGRHNVVDTEGAYESSYHTDSGSFEHTFEETGVSRYYCTPHKAMGMKGAIVVGDVEVTLSGGGGSPATTTASGPGGESGGDDEGLRTFDGWMDGVPNYDGVVDKTGADLVEVTVGPDGEHTFDPPAIHVDSGTTVRWTWADYEGDTTHDIRAADGQFHSNSMVPGSRYGVEFTGDGIAKYECESHDGDGMRGVVIVGAGTGQQLTPLGWAGIIGTLGLTTVALGKGLKMHMEETTGPGPVQDGRRS